MYSYYRSGVLLAKMMWDTDQLKCSEKNIDTNEWSPFHTVIENKYVIPNHDVHRIKTESETIHWEGNTVQFPSGYSFKRYKKISHHKDGNEQEAWIWAMPNTKAPIDVIVYDKRIIAFLYHSREESIILVEDTYEEFTPLTLWQDPAVSQASYSVNHQGTFFLDMRDGVKLATEVWLPKEIPEDHVLPTILLRTPYGRRVAGEDKLRFVHRGYAVVAQDVRCREDSEGEWIPCIHEIEDGDDTLNWIAAQEWSNKRVGMIGGSYGGFVQWAAAASGNPYLKAIVSFVTAGSPFGDLPRKGGTILSGISAWSFMMAERKMNIHALNRTDWDEVLKIRPIRDIPKKALGREIPFWNEWMNHSNYDEFWRKSDWSHWGENINVPALHISGWYDDDGVGTTESWEVNEKYERDHQKLILGPWYHKANSTREIHNVPFGLNAIRYDLDVMCQRWFDRFLKDIDNHVEDEPKIQYYTVGKNEWNTSESWPPEGANDTIVYLHSQGQARTSPDDGILSVSKPGNQLEDQYTFDPENPTPFLIDVSENECSVPENYEEVEARDDVLVYTSTPLTEDVEIAGNVYAVIYASSTARDTDWVVRLTDVDEEGHSIRLSDGIIRARYRHSFENPELLEPGKVEKYELKMTKIANCFKKGHRIRVSITSGADHLSFPNHNTGNNPADDTKYIIAHQKVYHDDRYPSHILLPIVKGALS
ncbi:putative CocE/NonD family hydrolase [Pullulanibacillus pueri]|uniref:Esterase n=1 Tax=Pullulanibacillus pueri TaxID=1437324 RepID=A0A8J3EM55_9BACL|nr:CocE/NonD family hydrolase [Pullulanibacillus pueri]MBM7682392.1 putative CocE/NonD family hydrolase [Pullulanibacillus pueri]GGH81817.1 esterase [Pullulanibacillus pueri]